MYAIRITRFTGGNQVNFNEYQSAAVKTAIYPREYAVIYPALGLAGEAGEVANKVKKIIRDGSGTEGVISEVADCLWYIAALASDLGVSLDDLAQQNLDKLKDRSERGQIGGSGDDR